MSAGRPFEEDVSKWLQSAMERRILGLDPKLAKIHRPYTAFSRDREDNITFDVGIEVFLKGGSRPFLLWLWECKDYSHAVPVNDIEEFHSKLQQVGRDKTKGIMISTAGFQKSVLSLADAYGITLIRVVSQSSSRAADEVERLLDPFLGKRDARIVRELGPMSSSLSSVQVPTAEALLQGAESVEPCFVTQALIGWIQVHKYWDQIATSLQ